MKEITEIVRETADALLPYFKIEIIVATALAGLTILATFGITIYLLAKHHRKGGRQ